MLDLVTGVLIICAIYVLSKSWNLLKLDYWSKRGVIGPKPSLIFGNIWDMMTGKKAMGEIYVEIYKYEFFYMPT